MVFVLLITAPPTHLNAWHSYYFAQAAIADGHSVKPFFYADGVMLANRLLCPAQNEKNLAQLWLNLAQQCEFELSVCVAAALRRGVSDAENASRHHLNGDNLYEGYTLTGLGVLTEGLITADRVISFVGE